MTVAQTDAAGGSTYPVRFASPRRDSVQEARTSARGTITWEQPLDGDDSTRRELLPWGDRVLLVGPQTVALHAGDGRELWQRQRRARSPVAIGRGLLHLESRSHFLQVIAIDNQEILADAPLPGIGGSETFLELLWPRAADFVVAATMPDPTYDAEEAAGAPSPQLFGLRVPYGRRFGQWSVTHEGTSTLAPMFVPATARWIARITDVLSIEVESGVEHQFAMPLEAPLDWSTDPAGVIAVIGRHRNAKTLVALDPEGVEQWRYVDDRPEDDWAADQPPIGSAAGRLYVLTGQRLLAFDRGRTAWVYDAGSESLRHGAAADDGSFEIRDGRLLSTLKLRHATALVDGSILLVGGRRLWHIDAAGRRLFMRELPGEILSPPVVGASGEIYLATARSLFRID